VVSKEDRKLFREAVRDVVPIPRNPVPSSAKPEEQLPPVPIQSLLDDRAVLRESTLGPRSVDDALDSGNEESFLRPGLQRELLRKLRRGHWVVQAELDLHGFSAGEAGAEVSEFLARCVKREWRCVRIVHGKGLGSPRREPVLKGKVKLWLTRRDAVLAYCQAPANQGGSGALLVLLQGTKKKRG